MNPASLVASVLVGLVGEPTAPANPEHPVVETINESVDLYGRLAGHVAYGPSLRFANNGTRFGIAAQVDAAGWIGVFGRLEFGAKLGDGDETFNLEAAGPGGFGLITVPTSPSVYTRLGFIGLDFKQLGKLSFGKQWGVHYDLTGRTDLFDIFGARASSTYSGRTDGGPTGTGRANNALIYRFSALGFDVGVQAQLLEDGFALDEAAVSLRYTAPFGLSLASAFTHSYYSEVLREDRDLAGFTGFGSRILAFAVGQKLGGFDIDAVYVRSWNHEVAFDDDGVGRVYDADGVEILASWLYRSRAPRWPKMGERNHLRLVAGYNGLYPRGAPAAIDYALHDLIVGVRAFVFDFAWVYLEGRAGLGRETDGSRTASSIALGIRYEFSSQRGIERLLAR